MPLSLVREDITRMDVDAIVNAANTGLRMGGGVCGAIFRAAGPAELQAACDEIGHVDTGKAVITPGFRLPAKWVIHTAGPVWYGGGEGERELLASCYTESLALAEEAGAASIAFPLISSGIYGYPHDEALEVATEAISDYLAAADSDMDVRLILFDGRTRNQNSAIHAELKRFMEREYDAIGDDRAFYERFERQYRGVEPIPGYPPYPADDLAGSYGSAPLPGSGPHPQAAPAPLRAPVPKKEGSAGSRKREKRGFRFPWQREESEETAFERRAVEEADEALSYSMPMAEESPSIPAQGYAEAPRTAAAPSAIDSEQRLADLLDELDAPFHVMLMQLIDERGLKDSDVYHRANLSRQYFSKLRSGQINPSKRVVLALAVALELPFAECGMLLERAGYAFTHSSRFDVIVEFFIRRGIYDVFAINEALFSYDQPLLGVA